MFLTPARPCGPRDVGRSFFKTKLGWGQLEYADQESRADSILGRESMREDGCWLAIYVQRDATDAKLHQCRGVRVEG